MATKDLNIEYVDVPCKDQMLKRAFLLGYAYAMGVQYGYEKSNGMVFDENDNHNPENGRFAPKGDGGSGGKEDFLDGVRPEVKEKIERISIDFSKDNYLPELNPETLEAMGKSSKPVLLKQNIIEKNRADHKDLTESDYKKIIGKSLYDPDDILPANQDKPAYFNFLSRIGKDKSTIVLLEMSETKDNYEIVNLHYLKDRQRSQKERKGERIKALNN